MEVHDQLVELEKMRKKRIKEGQVRLRRNILVSLK